MKSVDCVLDFVRGSVVCETEEDVVNAKAALEAPGSGARVMRIKNGHHPDAPSQGG